MVMILIVTLLLAKESTEEAGRAVLFLLLSLFTFTFFAFTLLVLLTFALRLFFELCSFLLVILAKTEPGETKCTFAFLFFVLGVSVGVTRDRWC